MTTDVKFFHSTMVGAPQISGTAGAMIGVLDAVLVNGFGLQTVSSATVVSGVCTFVTPTAPSAIVGTVILVAGATPSGLNGEKRVTAITANSVSFATTEPNGTPTGTITIKVAPAGWIKAFSGTNKAAYKIDLTAHPDSPSMLVHFNDSTAYNAKIIGYESMSDIDTGVGPFPSAAQVSMYVHKSSDTSVRPWFIVADGQFVYVGVRSYATSNANCGPSWFGFGEFASKKSGDPYNFMVTGNYNVDTSPNPDQAHSIASTVNVSFIYLARNYTGIGVGVKGYVKTWPSDYGGSGGSAAPLSYPNPTDYGLYLCPVDIFDTYLSNLRGRMPGMLSIPHNLVRKVCTDAATAYLDSDVPALPGKTVGFMPCVYSGTEWGVVAFDLTGPWEH